MAIKIKSATKRKATIKNYKLGYFVEPNSYANGGFTGSGAIDSYGQVAQMGASALSSAQPVNGDTNGWISGGSGALSGAATGAKLGLAFGGVGALVGAGAGALIGGVSGLISGGKQHDAYLRQQKQITSNNYFNTRSNMQTQNVDPYGMQMAYGDFVTNTSNKPGDPPNRSKILSLRVQTPNFMLPKIFDQSAVNNDMNFLQDRASQWGSPKFIGGNNVDGYRYDLSSQIPLTYKVDGTNSSGVVIPGYNQQINPTPTTIKSSNNYFHLMGGEVTQFSTGGAIGLPGRANGKFTVPNAGLRRFAPHMQRPGHINPLPPNNINFNSTQQGNSTAATTTTDGIPHMAQGDTIPTSTQQNLINIQKGELLINPEDGKILQDYKGINPLTGGSYESHSKGKKQESPNNFTLADPGLFVITKKTAGQYKSAMDNNDKISQKTVLMNIRNAKIAKEGGLQGQQDQYNSSQGNYAMGDYIDAGNSPTHGLPNIGNYSMSSQDPNSINQDMNTHITHPIGTTASTPPNKWGQVADTLSKYGPSLFNIEQGIFGQTQHQSYANPIINQDRNNVIANMPKNVNMAPIINDVYNNQNLANSNVDNQTSNAAVARANKQNVNSNTNKALINARMQASEVNNQAAGQRAYMYNALGYQGQQAQEQERQYNLGVDEINARRSAAKQNLLNAGLSQLQQTSVNDKANSQKQGMDKYTLNLLKQIFPNLKYYDEFDAERVLKSLH